MWFTEHGFREARHAARLLGVRREREGIDRRIEARTAKWLAEGWIDEVRGLVAAGAGAARAMGSVGYKQVKEHLDGGIPEGDLETAIIRATRVFVRRQRTWLRDEEVVWVGG